MHHLVLLFTITSFNFITYMAYVFPILKMWKQRRGDTSHSWYLFFFFSLKKISNLAALDLYFRIYLWHQFIKHLLCAWLYILGISHVILRSHVILISCLWSRTSRSPFTEEESSVQGDPGHHLMSYREVVEPGHEEPWSSDYTSTNLLLHQNWAYSQLALGHTYKFGKGHLEKWTPWWFLHVEGVVNDGV